MKTKEAPRLSLRVAPVRGGTTPKTIDTETRTVEFVAATERPVKMWDWEEGEIDEVLLMSGCVLPPSRQIPLLNTHNRSGVEDVIGSARELRIEGTELLATAHFASIPRAVEAFSQIAEGHLTDCSVGYRVSDYTSVKKGEKAVIGGRTWNGPVRVVTSWIPKELSPCPIGADEAAKARSEQATPVNVEINNITIIQKEPPMTDHEKQELETLRAEKAARDAEEKGKLIEREAVDVQVAFNAQLQQARERELSRIKEITAAGAKYADMGYDMSDLVRKCIDDRSTVEVSLSAMLARANASKPADNGLHIVVTADERDKGRAAAIDALTFRGGLREEKFDPQGNDFVRMSISDLAHYCLRASGQPAKFNNRESLIERAMSTSDLPYILASTANKYLYQGWDETPATYQVWCDEGSLNDYKTATFPRPSAFPDLVEANPETGEYKYASFGDQVESVGLKHWGRLMGVTLKALINDDLGVFTATPRRFGEAAKRTIDKYVYQTVLQGTAGAGETMGDGNALFDASNHANYVGSGSGATISGTTLDALAQKLEAQTDADGNAQVGDSIHYVLANPYYRFTLAQTLVGTNPIALGTAASPVYNPWQTVVPVFTPHITINSKKWWAVAGPKGKTVTVFGLNGAPRPTIDDRPEFLSASWTYRIKMDFVAKAKDWRYLAANYGT